MISSRPNLAYLKAAWAAHASISAENSQQTYEQAGISFERVNHSWIVRRGPVQVSTMPNRFTRQELRMGFLGRIEMEARKASSEMEAGLLRDLQLPAEHFLVVEMEPCMRMLRKRGNRALSMFVGPRDDVPAEQRVYAQILLFLDAPRACLYAHREDHADLLALASKRQCHPRASSYGELAQATAGLLNQAFEGSFMATAAVG